jgi:PST family polysaccharide transporter
MTDKTSAAGNSPDASQGGSLFHTEHLSKGIGRLSAKGAVVTVFGRFGKFGIQLAALAILTRLLGPEDFGLVNMAVVVTGFIATFSEMGLPIAIIQAPELRHDQMSNLFWLSASLGLLLTSLVACLAPIVALAYHEPRLVGVTAVAGCVFFASSLGIQHQALMKRQMRFKTLASIELLAGLIASLIGVACAGLHFGYWSLVVMQVAASASVSAISWLSCPWRPGYPRRGAGIASIVGLGGNLTVFNSLNFIVRNADNFLVGRRWGAAELGYYARAYQLMLLPLSQIVGPVGTVAVPALSRLQGDPEAFRAYYLKGLRVIAYASMPMLVVLAVLSEDVIRLVMGPGWHPASRMFRVLAMAALFQPVINSTGWILHALGRGRTYAYWGLAVTPVMIAAFLLGLRWGGVGVAIGYTIADWTLSVPNLFVATYRSPVSVGDVLSVAYRPLLLALFMGSVVFLVRLAPVMASPLIAVSLPPAAGVCAAVVAGWFWPALERDFRALGASLSAILGRPSPGDAA